jgi:hypothetical protein
LGKTTIFFFQKISKNILQNHNIDPRTNQFAEDRHLLPWDADKPVQILRLQVSGDGQAAAEEGQVVHVNEDDADASVQAEKLEHMGSIQTSLTTVTDGRY